MQTRKSSKGPSRGPFQHTAPYVAYFYSAALAEYCSAVDTAAPFDSFRAILVRAPLKEIAKSRKQSPLSLGTLKHNIRNSEPPLVAIHSLVG